MNQESLFRRNLLLSRKAAAWLACAALVPLVVLSGCKASTGSKASTRVASEVAENIDDYHVERVAILGYSNESGNTDGVDMERYFNAALYEEPKYFYSGPNAFESEARSAGVLEDHERLVRTWRKTHTLDAKVVKKVLDATGDDAILALVVTKWEQVKLEADQEGTSDTSVGIEAKMFGPDGALLWSASDLKTVESPPYLPSFNTRSTVSGRAVTTSQGAVPDPPEFDQVAMEVARNVISVMPVIKKDQPESD